MFFFIILERHIIFLFLFIKPVIASTTLANVVDRYGMQKRHIAISLSCLKSFKNKLLAHLVYHVYFIDDIFTYLVTSLFCLVFFGCFFCFYVVLCGRNE